MKIYLITFLLQTANAQSEFAKIWAIIATIIAVALGLSYFFSSKAKQTHEIESKRADTLEKLLKIRESELESLKTEILECKKSLDSMTTEYKAVVGITIRELIDVQKLRLDLQIKSAEVSTLEDEIVSLRTKLREWQGNTNVRNKLPS